ncbi:hypothetical protein TNCV_3299391 [Trichonephila clavipes]|uniref:Secreted protein n=1 Tax=Trichonephila clavipes TaxID=2585209 RepID=A0A8X6VTP8_TRICX|nr:hypothetical protein TNCV_3299391 [Trichonephila clavipes]
MFKCYLPIRLNCFLGLLVLPIQSSQKRVVHACTTTGQEYTTRCCTRSPLTKWGNRMVTALSQGYIQSLSDSMPRRVVVVIANKGSYT